MYPTGRVRIYSEPNYVSINGIERLANGAVAKHGRGQFGTKVVAHSAGLNSYWSNNENVRGFFMDSSALFVPPAPPPAPEPEEPERRGDVGQDINMVPMEEPPAGGDDGGSQQPEPEDPPMTSLSSAISNVSHSGTSNRLRVDFVTGSYMSGYIAFKNVATGKILWLPLSPDLGGSIFTNNNRLLANEPPGNFKSTHPITPINCGSGETFEVYIDLFSQIGYTGNTARSDIFTFVVQPCSGGAS
jgi:hypothetical protein